jgi:hypothetical protein
VVKREAAVKSLAIKTALLGTMLAACFTAAPRLNAQTQGDAPGQPAQNAAQSPAKVQTQSDQNPFPDDTSSVPLMSTHKDDLPADLNDDADSNRIPLPAEDADPVRTPEQAAAASEEGQQNFSSSLTGMGNLLPSSDAARVSSKSSKSTRKPPPKTRASATTISTKRIGGPLCRAFSPRWFSIPTTPTFIGDWPKVSVIWAT